MAQPPEAIENLNPPAIAPEEDVSELLFQDVAFAHKKIQAWAPEIVVGGKPGESHNLPGRYTLEVLKNGAQQVATRDKTTGEIIDSVTVKPDGSIGTSSSYGGKFQIRQDGNRQYVTTPGGDMVVIEGGRIVKTCTGGHTTEMLTPAQSEAREEARRVEREQKIEKELQKTAESISNALANGNVPTDALRQAFSNAQMGFYGKDGVARLTKMLEITANEGLIKPMHQFSVAQNVRTGELQVTVSNRYSGDTTNMTIPQIRFRKAIAQ